MNQQKQKLKYKDVPIRHRGHALRNILLMSVSTGLLMLFAKRNNPLNNFSVRKIK